MLQAKDWVLIAGIALVCIGFESLPRGQSLNPKSSLSLFAQSASSGAFLSPGALLLVVGLLVVGVSFLLPRK